MVECKRSFAQLGAMYHQNDAKEMRKVEDSIAAEVEDVEVWEVEQLDERWEHEAAAEMEALGPFQGFHSFSTAQ